MHVIFVEPHFPAYQKQFVRALKEVGARVTGIGETPGPYLPDDVKGWLDDYEHVPSVTNEDAMFEAVRRIQSRGWVDSLESTIEAHMLTTARVREGCTIPGVSYEQTLICRDKTLMKEFMRKHGIPCAMSTAASSAEEIYEFGRQVGYPLILKPRDAAGASNTWRVDNEAELGPVLQQVGATGLQSVAVEEFIEGHEGFYDTMTVNGQIAHDFISHYYPNVLEAMRTRWISPVIIVTNRDDAPGYNELKGMGWKVIQSLGLQTTPTHMEWFFGPKGLKFSEIGARPPGVSHWDLYCAANDIDLYKEWAAAIVYGRCEGHLSRNYSAAIINLRPTQDGYIQRYEGIDRMNEKYGQWVIKAHFPAPGTPTQGVEAGYMANAWIHIKYPDYDGLRAILEEIGQTIKVIAA
jgi:carbamoylphosphate synthase large subunit